MMAASKEATVSSEFVECGHDDRTSTPTINHQSVSRRMDVWAVWKQDRPADEGQT